MLRVNPADIAVITAVHDIDRLFSLFAEDKNRCPCKLHLHDRLADRKRGDLRLHLGHDDRLQACGFRFHLLAIRREDIRGSAEEFNRLRTLAMVVFQAAFVTPELFSIFSQQASKAPYISCALALACAVNPVERCTIASQANSLAFLEKMTCASVGRSAYLATAAPSSSLTCV